MKKRIISLFLVLLLLTACPLAAQAHSGRTDAQGGHRDNKNASGLGSYHYHHGYPAHLHTGGVCPYSTSGQASSGGAGSAGASGSSSAPAPQAPSTALSSAESALADKAQTALREAQADAKTSALLTLEDEAALSLPLMQELARLSDNVGLPLKLHCNSRQEEKLVLRLTINPAKATKGIALGGQVSGERPQRIQEKFSGWYKNTTAVISLGHQGSLGMEVELAAKVDLTGLDVNALRAYAYNEAENTRTDIDSQPWVDESGFLHLNITTGGDIIITDRPLSD